MTPRPRTETEEIVAHLQRAHRGDPWHGPSRAMILADVTAQVAAWEPGAGAHGIWGQVLHMRNWTREVEQRALGVPRSPDGPVGGDWPEIPQKSEAAWKETLASLDAAHEQLVAVTQKLPAARLHEHVDATPDNPGGSGVSVSTMLKSLAEHDIYHSGQVSLLKRLARAALGLKQS